MKVFGKELTLFKKRNDTLSPAYASGGGWFNALFPWVVHEANTGDWQRNICLSMDCLLSNPIVFACITLIAGDIGKLRPMLMQYREAQDIYVETTSPSFSPVINAPNKYQNRIEFFTQWIISLLAFGNAYVLKVRDQRNVVTDLYVLDPRRVLPLVSSQGGEVFYQLSQDNIADIEHQITVPASEIIHDKVNCMFHPLVGLSPLFGCGLAATQGIEMQRNSVRFFKKGATPSGIIMIPGSVDPVKAQKIKDAWAGGFTGANAGAVAILADGAKFEQMTMKSTDSELVSQLNLSNEQICSCFHVPGYMVGVGSSPTYNNIEALNQQYYNQCLQVLIEKVELCMTTGLNMTPYSMCFDIKQLLRMDTAARYKANGEAIKLGWMSPDEARQSENLPPVEGGDTPYMQQQNFSLAALKKRDALPNPFVTDRPFINDTPAPGGSVDQNPVPPAPGAAPPEPKKLLEQIEQSVGHMLEGVRAETKRLDDERKAEVQRRVEEEERRQREREEREAVQRRADADARELLAFVEGSMEEYTQELRSREEQ